MHTYVCVYVYVHIIYIYTIIIINIYMGTYTIYIKNNNIPIITINP